MTAVAALAAAVACWLLVGPAPGARLRGLRRRDGHGPPGRFVARLRRVLGPALALAAAGLMGTPLSGPAGATLGVAAALPVLTGVAVWRRHRRRSEATARADQASAACRLLVGLLRVGHVPASAVRVAARDAPVLAEAAAVLDIGGTVPPVLRRRGSEPGASGLLQLAAAWEVADRTGASLTATLEALGERLDARHRMRHVVAAELSAPRATGRLLAVLPVAGVVLGYAFGGDPLAFLTGSLPGRLSLLTGVALGCTGVLWTERIADREEA